MTDADATTRLTQIHQEWMRRIQDWEADVAAEANEQVRNRKQKALTLLKQGIDPYPSVDEATGSPAYVKLLREVRLGQF